MREHKIGPKQKIARIFLSTTPTKQIPSKLSPSIPANANIITVSMNGADHDAIW